MLQQILRDLYVDPDILSGLDEDQKQILFCKMREEQIRRWSSWDRRQSKEPPPPPRNNKSLSEKKSVSFLNGIDGEPWVWVMGEHEDDDTIEEILQRETIEKARKLAEQEAQQMRKVVEKELTLDYIDLSPTPKIETLAEMKAVEDIYCSVEELRRNTEILSQKKKPPPLINNYSIGQYAQAKNKFCSVLDSRDVVNELSRCKPAIAMAPKVAQKVELWEKRLTEERTCEIFQNIQLKQQEAAKEAEEAEKKQEKFWMEQERKAKEAEQQKREVARRAREEHRLTSSNATTDPTPSMELDVSSYSTVTVPSGVPPGRQAVIEWYRNTEVPRRTGLNQANQPEPWFHGLITRVEAEKRLQEQPEGSYLVRVSERIWGYAVSYRARDKCKHYLVNAGGTTAVIGTTGVISQPTNTSKAKRTDPAADPCDDDLAGIYSFLGNNQIEHKNLRDLIEHHNQYPLSGGEKLVRPCPRSSAENLHELLGL